MFHPALNFLSWHLVWYTIVKMSSICADYIRPCRGLFTFHLLACFSLSVCCVDNLRLISIWEFTNEIRRLVALRYTSHILRCHTLRSCIFVDEIAILTVLLNNLDVILHKSYLFHRNVRWWVWTMALTLKSIDAYESFLYVALIDNSWSILGLLEKSRFKNFVVL